MKGIHEFKNIYLHRHPIDMRKGIHSLIDVVISEKMGSFDQVNIFVFIGKRRHTIKVLYFDRSGFCLWIKQLEKDQFSWPKTEEDSIIHTSDQLDWLLKGINIWKIKPFQKIQVEHFF
jgi:transposase